MCGIAGIIDRQQSADTLRPVGNAMLDRMRHRGPDGNGVLCEHGCLLVHTRLSILDLSESGNQPMTTSDGRYSIVFNGEIYNFQALREELIAKGVPFRSRTDTEVVLELFRSEGAGFVNRLEGMFAFAIWDHTKQEMFLARDPLGIKPLYIWWDQGRLAFASEVKALLLADLGPKKINRHALAGYLLYGSVQEPDTLVEDVACLPAGQTALWSDDQLTFRQYWAPRYPEISNTDPASEVREVLLDSIKRHFVSDVPVSIFLSGGIDSTGILALAKQAGYDNLQTFCISFDDEEFNEGSLAERTAKHFGTRHLDWRMTAEDGGSLVRQYLAAIDQPSNDGFNTFCVSKLAHQQGAKVVLSGLGGDELFGGYPSFHRMPQMMNLHRKLSVATNGIGWLAQSLSNRLPYQRLGAFLRSSGNAAVAHWAMRGFFLPDEVQQLVHHYAGMGAQEDFGELDTAETENMVPANQVAHLELTRYMRNQLLRDSDVMSMAWSLELRVPFVDRRVVDTVTSIHHQQRLQAGKQLLVDAVQDIPPWIANQPKRGFRFPFEEWAQNQWHDVFRQLGESSPVPLRTWYRGFSLLTLENFFRMNKIQTGSS